MGNIFDKTKINSILKDERYLYPDYVPTNLPFRDSEINEMVYSLKPATNGKKPTNLFLTGLPGTGKTATSKYVLDELSEYSDRTKTIYINCFKDNSKGTILAKITNKLGYPVPLRGISSSEIWERLISVIKNKKIVPVVVFDEAEQLLKSEDTLSMLYDLSRLSEQQKLFFGIILISNDKEMLSFIDGRTRSSLSALTLNFEKYGSPQLKEILKERAEYAFFDGVLGDEVIPLVAAHASKTGDARIAIDVLLKAARLAERENKQKVTVTHVRNSFSKEVLIKKEIIENFTKQEQLVFDLISEKGISAGDLYSKLNKDFAERTLRKAISELEAKGVITTKKERLGKGYTRLLFRTKKE